MTVVAVVVAIALAMLGLEWVRPGRRWPAVPTWWARALLINGIQIALVFVPARPGSAGCADRTCSRSPRTAAAPRSRSELPLIDILFGAFRNPRRFVGQCGLGAGRERMFVGLLLGRDVTKPRERA